MNKPRRTSRLYAEKYGRPGAGISEASKRLARRKAALQAAHQAEAASQLPSPTPIFTPGRKNGKTMSVVAKPFQFARNFFRRGNR